MWTEKGLEEEGVGWALGALSLTWAEGTEGVP